MNMPINSAPIDISLFTSTAVSFADLFAFLTFFEIGHAVVQLVQLVLLYEDTPSRNKITLRVAFNLM